MRLTGTCHVHSTYSWDGVHPLADLVAFLRGQGHAFVLMSEHDRGLTPARAAEFVAACDRLSDEQFLVVPGFEYEATPDYVHVLAYHTRGLLGTHDATELARGIRAQAGLAVLAHPHWRDGHAHVPAAAVALLDGWEVWNGKADGGLAPRAETIRRHASLRQGQPGLVPMAGADLHRLESYPGIVLSVDAEARTGEALVDALRRGRFTVSGRAFAFDAGAERLPVPRAGGRALVRAAARRIKHWAQRVDKRLARRGIQAPAPIYRLARRLFR